MRPHKSLIALTVVCVLAACAAPITPYITATLSPPSTAIPTSTPSPTATFAPTSTRYPTATFSPLISTAVAKGQCINSFDTFAYGGPRDRSEKAVDPLPPWQVEGAIQAPPIEGYEYGWGLNAAATRSIKGHQEIWLLGRLWDKSLSYDNRSVLVIYQPDTRMWETVLGSIGDSSVSVSYLFVTREGDVWGQTELYSRPDGSSDNIPVLAKFNEATRRFDTVQDSPAIPPDKVEQGYNTVRIVLDQQGIFWIFVEDDGIHRYDPAGQTTRKVVDMPDTRMYGPALSPDGSIYFKKDSDQTWSGKTFLRFVEGTLLRFTPQTKQVVPIDMPDEEWPLFSGLLVDHTGRLWLGSTGYRNTDGSWHMIDPHPERWFERADQGEYSYIWATPWPMLESSDGILWYEKALDTGPQIEGTAWYNPRTGEGCLFTNLPANIVEDKTRRLWLVADKKLYRYTLGQ